MKLTLDRNGPLPLHEQITGQIRLLIDSAELEAGAQLPTIKDAAREWGVNANTVGAAYRALEEEGYLSQRKRAGTSVAPRPPSRLGQALAGYLAADVAAKARAAGIEPSDLVRAVAAHGALEAEPAGLRIAVIADTPLRAAALAERAGAALGDGVRCVPLTPTEYRSVDYHLAVVDPLLAPRLLPRPEPRDERSHPAQGTPPFFLEYGPEFPAAAD
jgi:GntR family transcriptional regulator